jgi:hypothetical protein
MSAELKDPLATGLTYEDRLPLTWSALESLPEDWELGNLNEANESFLKLITTLEEYHPARQEREESLQEVYHELTRIDLKLNLLLEFVGQALNRKLSLPKRIEVRIGPKGLEWETDHPPEQDRFVRVDLFLYPRYPRPIELPGKVVQVITNSASSQVTMTYQGLSIAVQDCIEKIIFRHHRRSIANKRVTPL